MPTIYEHEIPNRRVITFARVRINEISKQIHQLQLEREIMEMIDDKFNPLVCQTCHGEGHIMKVIEGNECDGPRMHSCKDCNGKGEITQ
ncbi:MAG: hypothetical protein KAS32_23505 [Candidatus Peribacteraceae bacterium]|nr:hypothetical protein [Candidatus Peribacteraceae bacterium]